MKIYGNIGSYRVKRLLVAAKAAGIEVEFVPLGPGDSQKKDFLKKQPFGKYPVAEIDGATVYESGAILRLIANHKPEAGLYGANTVERGLIDQYIDVVAHELEPAFPALIYPLFGYCPLDADLEKVAQSDFKKFCAILNNDLKGKKYLVGDKLSIADINLVVDLYYYYQFYLDEKTRKVFGNLLSYFEGVVAHEAFEAVLGKFKYAPKALPKPAAVVKAAEQKAEPKKAAAGKTDNNAKKETKKKESDADEEQPKKKEVNPLDLLPPSSFNLFDFKTLFVNHPSKAEAMNAFWSQYDPAGYSLWHIKYDKYEGEGVQLIPTNNLMNGFLQRCDEVRKYAFGVFGVYGEEPSFDIKGLWVWRGTEIPKEIKDLPSYEYYFWTKLDHTKEEDKAKVAEYWCNQNEGDVVDGQKLQTFKYMK